MLNEAERKVIARLWQRKLAQDAAGLPQAERHRNLEPESAEFIHALAAGLRAQRLLEIGGSSGISTIALAAAARETGGKLKSIEIEPRRQAEAQKTIHELDLADLVEFVCADAAGILPNLGEMDFVLIDCEKDDYAGFFDMLKIAHGGVVVADNILSHQLDSYVKHVRKSAPSITLPIGKGLEITRPH